MMKNTTKAPVYSTGTSYLGDEWREIPGFEGRYMVSRDGQVKSLKRDSILKVTTRYDGYKIVSLYDKRGKRYRLYVHRLVAKAFLKNPYNYPCVNHIDTDRGNNSVSNLEWTTELANIFHPLTVKHKKDAGKARRRVVQVFYDGIKIMDSTYLNLSFMLNVPYSTMIKWAKDGKIHKEHYKFVVR